MGENPQCGARNGRHWSFVIGHLQRQMAGNGEQATANSQRPATGNRERGTAGIGGSGLGGDETAKMADGGTRPGFGIRGPGFAARGSLLAACPPLSPPTMPCRNRSLEFLKSMSRTRYLL